jgi:hypothetical protein
MVSLLSFYVCFLDEFWTKSNRFKELTAKDASMILGRQFHVPKELRYEILREMEYYKFLKFVGSRGGLKSIRLIKKPTSTDKLPFGNKKIFSIFF